LDRVRSGTQVHRPAVRQLAARPQVPDGVMQLSIEEWSLL
jgi:Zn-finger domain-containing protein